MQKSIRATVALSGALLFTACATAPAKPPAPSGPAPILDRELFFGDPEITGAQLSPDGRFIAFIKPLKGTRNVWVKETGKPFDTARPLTADLKRPIPGFFFSRDGKYVLYVQDQAGDENFNIFAVDPTAQAAAGKDAPDARDLTGMKKVRASIYSLPKSDPDTLYVGFNDRDPAWHDLYKVTISTGQKELVRKNTEHISGWIFDHAGKLRLATRTAENGDTETLRVDGDGFTKIYSCSVLEECGPQRFDAKNERVYFETNKGDADLSQLVLLDPATGNTELVERDPDGKVDFGQALFAEATDELVGTAYNEEKLRYYFRDPAWKSDYDFLRSKFEGKEVTPGSTTRDDQLWLISVQSYGEPGERWLFDRKTKALTFEYRLREALPREALAATEYIHYPSSDGLSIPAYLTTPRGADKTGLPLLVLPHGGPWGRVGYGFHGLAQFFANRGYAVLEPNFRGSTGYGKSFLNAGNKQWGERMQDDLTYGVKALVGSGFADGKRVGIIGGSYGGYATLAGVAFTPDLYQAAVAIVAPSNLITLLETIPPYWEAIRKIFHERMGDPTTAEGRAQLNRQSPLNSADKIKTPLMIVQGANDPRVNKRESDQIVIALRDRGFPVSYIVAPDEGHGFQKPINNLATFTAAEKFFARYLGGREQVDVKPEVATRLAELTIDPKTVVLAKKVDASAVAAPTPASDLAPGTLKYKSVIKMGANEMKLDVVRTIEEAEGGWAVTDVATTPMGQMSDRTVVQKGTLLAVQRDIKQGPMSIALKFEGGKASGSMAMGGPSKPIDADLGGPVFAEGNSEADVLAHLSLEPGFTATFRQFDIQKQKATFKQVKVAGSESVTVAAGTFDAVKVEVKDAEGPGAMTMWVDKASRKVVKQTATLPQMNGAQYTTELVE